MKAISAIIATIMLLMITVSLVGVFYVFSSTIATTTTASGGQQASQLTAQLAMCMRIDNIYGNQVTLRNCGKGVIENKSLVVTMDDMKLGASTTTINEGDSGTVNISGLWQIQPGKRNLKISNGATYALALVEVKPNPDGLVGRWDFNEGNGIFAGDNSGNGNIGTLLPSGSEPVWVNGKFGKGLQFDGTNEYVNVGNANSLSITNAFTLAAWIKSNTGNSYYSRTEAENTNQIGTDVSDLGTTSVKAVPSDGSGNASRYYITLVPGYYFFSESARVNETGSVNVVNYTIRDTVTNAILLSVNASANSYATANYKNVFFNQFYTIGNQLEVTAYYYSGSGREFYLNYMLIDVRRGIVGKPSSVYNLLIAGNAYRTDITNTTGSQVKFSAGTAGVNTWEFVTSTYNGLNTQIYVNGILKGTSSNLGGSIQSNTNPVSIGSGSGFSNDTFNGIIDEVRIWNRVLAPDETITMKQII